MMITLELTIQRKTDEGWPIIAEQIRPGALPTRSEELFTLEQSGLLSQVDPGDYGAMLGRAIFHGKIRDAFARALTESAEGVRLLLFVEADDLRTLRWERLCAPFGNGDKQEWDFLALNQRTLFSLYLPSVTDRRYPPIGQHDLRALVLVASPQGLAQYGLAQFDGAAAAAHVQQALGDIPFDLLASNASGPVANAKGPASLEALCERLTAEPYTLVHVVCHGHFNERSGETSLFLADGNHHLDRVEGARLLERLGRLRGRRGLPHFAFLATCESAAPAAEGALGGLAQRLVRDLGMPAVIAMTEKVSIETAQLLTSGFYARLHEYGEVDRALVEATIAAAERSDVTIPVMYGRLGAQPLFSRDLNRALTSAEIQYGLDTLKPMLAERAPVLQPQFEQAASTLRRTLSTDLASLSADAVAERQAALEEIEQIAAKAIDLSFKAFCLGRTPPAYDARCPFRGLAAFGVDDQSFFFGREALVQQARQHLQVHPFLAILGPSGSGKSSLVLAGLIPLLQQESPALTAYVITPGADPVAALTAAKEKLALAVPMDGPTKSGRAILVVDQFEEIFTLCPDQAVRQAFFQQLLALASRPNANAAQRADATPELVVVLTMRADFWGDCAAYPALRDAMLAHQMLIGPMRTAELRAAMEQQARAVGLRFEADLAHTMLDDVAGEPGAMPLLQHALRELWQRRHGRWLVAAEYREMGGVKKAIARTAELIYNGLSSADQDRLRSILTRLTRLDEEALPGENRRDTRRRVAIDELVSSEAERLPISALVTELADQRLLVTNHNTLTEQDEVEVAHEALIREWPRLQTWIAEDMEGLRIQRQLAAALAQWQRNHQDPSFLFRGGRLRMVRAWQRENPALLNQQEQAFVAEGVRRERLGLLRKWGTRAAMVVLPLLVALAVMWVGRSGLFADPKVDWRQVETLHGVANDLVWDVKGNMYASFEPGGASAIAMSSDAGQTWQDTPIPVQGVGAMASNPYVPEQIYAVASDATLWKTGDAGRSWSELSLNTDVWDVAMSPQQALYVVAGEWADELYTSVDLGQTWRPIEGESGGEIFFIKWQPDHLLIGREDGIWSWSPEAQWSQPVELEVAFILSAVQYQEQLWVATSSGLYRVAADGSYELVTREKFQKLALLVDESTAAADGPSHPAVIVAASESEIRWFPTEGGESTTIGLPSDLGNAQDIRQIRANGRYPNSLWVAADSGLFYGNPAEYLK